MQTAQILEFKQENDINVYDYIETFLNYVGKESQNTQKAYKNALEAFFEDTRGKYLTEIQKSDLGYNLIDLERYQTGLMKKYKSSTINNRMVIINNFMKKMRLYGLEIDVEPFEQVKRLKEGSSQGADALTKEEVESIQQFALSQDKGREKYLFVGIAFATAFRKESIIKLKYSDVYRQGSHYLITTMGKGNKRDTKKLTPGLYQEIQEHKGNKSDSDSILDVSVRTMERFMDKVKKHFDFGNRNISIHSFKKSSIMEVALLTNNDVKAMQRQANHSSAKTTMDSYAKYKDIEDMVIVDSHHEFDLSVLETLTKEQLIDIITKSTRPTQHEIVEKAKEI